MNTKLMTNGILVTVDENAYVHVLCKFRIGDKTAFQIFVASMAIKLPDDDISSVMFWTTTRFLGVVEVCIKAKLATTLCAYAKLASAFSATISLDAY